MRFTTKEQLAGLRRLWAVRPDLAERGIDDPEALEAWVDCIEDAIMIDGWERGE